MIRHIFFSSLTLLIASCSKESKQSLKVVATPVPHAQMLEYIKPKLQQEGIDLKIIVTDDYNMPNRALAHKEVDANFFQHIPFLEEQIKQFHYPIQSIAKIEIEPMGIYSKKLTSLKKLQAGSKIAIPNDPTNEARALLLLQAEGFIQLDNPQNLQSTVLNIAENQLGLQFIEVDAAMLPRTLSEVDAAVINTNYVLEAGLNPFKDALAFENKDSPYVNVLVVRDGEENREDIQALKKAMTSDDMRVFILEKYRGAVIPAF